MTLCFTRAGLISCGSAFVLLLRCKRYREVNHVGKSGEVPGKYGENQEKMLKHRVATVRKVKPWDTFFVRVSKTECKVEPDLELASLKQSLTVDS